MDIFWNHTLIRLANLNVALFRSFIPFRTRRFIMQMAVHYFFNTDFRFTFLIKFKFNFINWHESVEYSTELAINLNAEFN